MQAINEFGETYEEMLTRYERTAARVARDLTAHLTAANTVPELAFTAEWQEHLRTLAHFMRGLPELLLQHAPPPHLKVLYAMYQKWAPPYNERACLLLDAVAALEASDLARYSQVMHGVSRLSDTVAKLSEARHIYIRGALCNQT